MTGDRVVGTVTSGDWGHRVGANIAYAFVDPDHAEAGTALAIDIIGIRTPARVTEGPLYDPGNSRVRP